MSAPSKSVLAKSATGDSNASESTSAGATPKSSFSDAQSIRWVTNFHEMYVLGQEVKPSGHPYMKLHFARRMSDYAQVVVKVQYKPKCFRNKDEEKQWRECTEYLLNLPESAGVVKLHEVLEDDKAFYIVMDKVDGMDLHQVMDERGVTVEMAREILFTLLKALAHLHAHNAVHKDLKLENIMIGTVPIEAEDAMDSIQRTVSDNSVDSAATVTSIAITPKNLTIVDFDTMEKYERSSPSAKRGTPIVGTNQYIAQEAYAGKYSPASDIFSVGVIAYMLLTSKFPFSDKIFDDKADENWVGSPKLHQIRCRLKKAEISFLHPVFKKHPQSKDLVKQMLSHKEEDRPTASAALEHPFFEGLASANDDLEKRHSNPAKGYTSSVFDEHNTPVTETIVEEVEVNTRCPFWCVS